MHLHTTLKVILILMGGLIAVPAMFLLWMTLADFKPPEREQLRDAEPVLFFQDSVISLLTWNIGYAGLGREMDFFYDGGKRSRAYPSHYEKYRKGIRKYLGKPNFADIILIQEVDRNSRRSFGDDQMGWLQDTLKGYHADFAWNYKVGFVPLPLLRPMGKVNAGLATFSAVPPTLAERVSFHGNYKWPLRLFMLDRCYIISRFPLPGRQGRELVIINTHNSAFDDGTLRQQQIEMLALVMEEEYDKGNYVIAGGDWNINPPGYMTGDVKTGDWSDYAHGVFMSTEDFPPGWKWAYDPATPTNRRLIEPYMKSRTPTTIIDFFVVSPNVEILETVTTDLGFEDSDHNPVHMKVRLSQ